MPGGLTRQKETKTDKETVKTFELYLVASYKVISPSRLPLLFFVFTPSFLLIIISWPYNSFTPKSA